MVDTVNFNASYNRGLYPKSLITIRESANVARRSKPLILLPLLARPNQRLSQALESFPKPLIYNNKKYYEFVTTLFFG